MKRKDPVMGILRRSGFLGPFVSLLLMTVLLIPMVYALRNHLYWIASGGLFERTFRLGDAVSIINSLLAYTYLALIAAPYVATSYLLVERRTRLGYWLIFLPVLTLASCLLCALIPGVYGLLQYVDKMGITPKRIAGLVYSATCITVTAGVVGWAAWPSKKKTA